MPPSALRRPVVRSLDYRGAGNGVRPRAGRLQPGQARLRPGEPARLPLARRLRRLRRRAVAQGARARSTTTLAWHRRTQLPDYVRAARARRGRGRRDATPERMCAWAGEISEPHRAGRCSTSRRRSPTSRSRSRRRRSRTSRSASPRPTRSTATSTCSATRSGATRPRSKREVEPRRDALRRARRRRSASWSRDSVATSPYDAEVAVRRAQGAPAGRAGAGAPPARGEPGPRRRASPRCAPTCSGIDRSPREGYRRYAERVIAHRLRPGERAAQQRQRRAAARGGEEARRLSRRRARADAATRRAERARRRVSARRAQCGGLDRDAMRVGRAAGREVLHRGDEERRQHRRRRRSSVPRSARVPRRAARPSACRG